MIIMTRSFLLLFAFLLALTASACAEPPSGYKLQWADEFDGAQLDAKKWKHWFPGKRRDATDTPDAVVVRDGYLSITTYTENGQHFTGVISTQGLYESRFGYWEARIQWADAPGSWSAFWSMPLTIGEPVGDVAKAGAEIDFVEHRSVDDQMKDIANTANFTLHYDGYGKDHKVKSHATGRLGLAEGFHVYGCEWSEDGYRFFIDGKQFWSIDGPVSKRTQFIILSTEVDSKAWSSRVPKEGYGDRATSKVKLVVDYVRYYTKP